ncbi:hypothetical protein, partial [Erwinia amylovora]
FGRCRWQRCLTYVRPDLLQVRSLPGLRTAKRRFPAAFLHWWVVQDDFGCASPFGRCRWQRCLTSVSYTHLDGYKRQHSTRPAAGANPARFAPVSYTHLGCASHFGRCRWQRCLTSVSYTHLDGYKRQHSTRPAAGANPARFAPVSYTHLGCASHFGRCRWQRCLTSVSYTHLDGYKRQHSTRPAAGANPARFAPVSYTHLGCASHFGRCRWQRCLTSVSYTHLDGYKRQHSTRPAAGANPARFAPVSYTHLGCASHFGRCRWQRCLTSVSYTHLDGYKRQHSTRPAAGANPARFAPVSYTHLGCASHFGRCRWQRCLTSVSYTHLDGYKRQHSTRPAAGANPARFAPVSYTHLGCASHFGRCRWQRCLTSVSYTHLDGYKRQHSTRPAAGANPARFAPVSYTHLDVYKRQGFEPATN